MLYKSTRGGSSDVTFSQAVKMGIAPDGGLFVPQESCMLTAEEFQRMAAMSYKELAVSIVSRYAGDFTAEDIEEAVTNAYCSGNFPADDPAPVVSVSDSLNVLELWHGPTSAFKDMALQILPEFMTRSNQICGDGKEIVILTATSGDTGKAALEGFKDVPGIRVIVFYPEDGVSQMQKYQMITQEGKNVHVIAVNGNFDDAQTGVKGIFGDRAFAALLAENGYELSSANSINWGRLLPQIIYYFHGYYSLVRQGKIALGDKVNIAVPTGNFGNILASYYAMKMGLPVNRIICASNDNNVLTDFLHTGTYDANRQFMTTISPAMDILVSSNLERLLYDVTGGDTEGVASYMAALRTDGLYTVDAKTSDTLQNLFWAGYATEAETEGTIRHVYEDYGYLADTHTAVGIHVYENYVKATGDTTQTIAASTASPFKFNKSVAEAIFGRDAVQGMTEFELLEYLSAKTGHPIPEPLKGLDQKPVLHRGVCMPADMEDRIARILGVNLKDE
jgi:threonine synthase